MHSQRIRMIYRGIVTAALLLGVSTAASAQVVYDNGVPNNVGGVKIYQPFSTANDFTLGSTTELTGFDWFAMYMGTNGPDPVTASFYWSILWDNSGLPGTSVAASGQVNASLGALTSYGGCCLPLPYEYSVYKFSTSLGNTTLGAGTYWLSLSNFQTNWGADHRWANSVTGQGNEAKTWTGSEWQTLNSEGAFTLYGGPGNPVNVVPEPASIALLATGLAGIGGFRARRRRKAD